MLALPLLAGTTFMRPDPQSAKGCASFRSTPPAVPNFIEKKELSGDELRFAVPTKSSMKEVVFVTDDDSGAAGGGQARRRRRSAAGGRTNCGGIAAVIIDADGAVDVPESRIARWPAIIENVRVRIPRLDGGEKWGFPCFISPGTRRC